MRVGVIGLGDMGSGLAKNLIENGFETTGYDLSDKRMAAFEALGGKPAQGPGNVGANADAVFVMVMTGDQAKSVLLGDDGAAARMSGGVVKTVLEGFETRIVPVDPLGHGIVVDADHYGSVLRGIATALQGCR